MSVHFPAAAFAEAKPVPTQLRRNRVERTFDLHPGIYAGLFGIFSTFLLVMAAAFMTRELILPFAIFFIYLGMYFGVPALWARVTPQEQGPRQSWAEFMHEGVETATGHTTASAALAQIFVLPILLLGWAVTVAVISALV